MFQSSVVLYRGKKPHYENINGVVLTEIASLQDVDFGLYEKIVDCALTGIDKVRVANCAKYYAKKIEHKQGRFLTLNPIDNLINDNVISEQSSDKDIKLGTFHILWLVFTRYKQFIKLLFRR